MRTDRFDPLSLLAGLVFIALGGAFLSGTVDVLTWRGDVVWATALVLGGAFALLAVWGGKGGGRQ